MVSLKQTGYPPLLNRFFVYTTQSSLMKASPSTSSLASLPGFTSSRPSHHALFHLQTHPQFSLVFPSLPLNSLLSIHSYLAPSSLVVNISFPPHSFIMFRFSYPTRLNPSAYLRWAHNVLAKLPFCLWLVLTLLSSPVATWPVHVYLSTQIILEFLYSTLRQRPRLLPPFLSRLNADSVSAVLNFKKFLSQYLCWRAQKTIPSKTCVFSFSKNGRKSVKILWLRNNIWCFIITELVEKCG